MPLRSSTPGRALLVAAVAIAMAFVSARFLFDASMLNVMPWGILAFATAFLAASRREALLFGATFGFVVSYAFLWFDNTGEKTLGRVLILIPLIVAPALFGALCGVLMAWVGWAVRRAVRR
jgi:hypothetical protein